MSLCLQSLHSSTLLRLIDKRIAPFSGHIFVIITLSDKRKMNAQICAVRNAF